MSDLSRRELFPKKDRASDRFLSVLDWLLTRRTRGRIRVPCLYKACTEHSNGFVQLGPYTVVRDPFLFPSAQPLGGIDKQGFLEQAECVLSSSEARPIGRKALASLSVGRRDG